MVRVWKRNSAPPGIEEKSHPLEDNTDFTEVFRARKPFACNNLKRLYRQGRYRNSNWAPRVRCGDAASPCSKRCVNSDRICKDGPGRIGYRASIVCPVHLEANRQTGFGVDAPRGIAFLCVDTQKVGAFRPPDIDMATAFAWALYPALKKRIDSDALRADGAKEDSHGTA